MTTYSAVRAASAQADGLTLHLEKVVPAAAATVFRACVEPERLSRWWGPAGFTTLDLELDVREEGQYRITMQPPDGEAFHLRGRFSEVDPPRRLTYTFEWEEPDPDDRETIVTLSFLDHPEGTKVVLDQGLFATDARLALHTAGWTETLDRLERYLAVSRLPAPFCTDAILSRGLGSKERR